VERDFGRRQTEFGKKLRSKLTFTLRFPSGFLASATTSYGYHNAKFYRVLGSSGW
jgi:hypothetical protein